MNKVLDSFAETYGVMWIAGKMHHARSEEDGAIIKRRRIILYSWYKTFFCHRSGEKEPPRPSTKESSKIPRPSQKPSKKINCPATMRITCYKKDPDNVVFTFQKKHNHETGTKEDFCHLPLSKTVKRFILQKLQEGFDCKDVRRQLNDQIQKSLSTLGNNNQIVFHRDQIIDRNEVYNMYKKLQETESKNREIVDNLSPEDIETKELVLWK